MSRWHASSCENPVIAVKAQIPYCQLCKSTPPLEQMIAKARQSSSFPPIPPDDMNYQHAEAVHGVHRSD